MNIFDKSKNKVKKFEELSKGCTDEEKRIMETQLLKPEPIPKYTGEVPKHKSDLHSRTSLIVFRDKGQMDLIGTIFNIRESVNGVSYITNIQLLEDIAKGVSNGKYILHDHTIDLPLPEAYDSVSDNAYISAEEAEEYAASRLSALNKKDLEAEEYSDLDSVISDEFQEIDDFDELEVDDFDKLEVDEPEVKVPKKKKKKCKKNKKEEVVECQNH